MSSTPLENHTFVFIAGLHRSGTSLLHRCLRAHPSISGFENTGVPEDEGQHLQSVFPTARDHGGPGVFGFDPKARLDEHAPLVSEASRLRLWSAWSRYWDVSRPFLIEKSPPNLIRTRFLQAMFPNSVFLVMLRHPIAVSLATKKWSRRSLHTLIRHWLHCHDLFRKDEPFLKRVLVLRYEAFAADPDSTLRRVYVFLRLSPHPHGQHIRADVNARYFARWMRYRRGLFTRHRARRIIQDFEDRIGAYGYSLMDPTHRPLTSDVGPSADGS